MTIQNKRILASILFILISFVCIAQGEGAPPTPSPEGPPPPPFPIDGAVLLGGFIALAYGARKLLSSKK